MRVWRLRVFGSVALSVALGLGALPVSAHPTIDVANPSPNDRVIAGSMVMELMRVSGDHGLRPCEQCGIALELHRFSNARAGSIVTEIEGASHFAQVSHPEVVAGVIRDAVTSSVEKLVA